MKTFIVLICGGEKIRIKAHKTEILVGTGYPPTLRFLNGDSVAAEFQWPSIVGYYEQDAEA